MKHLRLDRRLLVSLFALICMYFRPEIAGSAAAVAIALSGANAAQAILEKKPSAEAGDK